VGRTKIGPEIEVNTPDIRSQPGIGYVFFLACAICFLLKHMLAFVAVHRLLSDGAIFLLSLPLGLFGMLAVFPFAAIVGLGSWPDRPLFAVGLIFSVVDLILVCDYFFEGKLTPFLGVDRYLDTSHSFLILAIISLLLSLRWAVNFRANRKWPTDPETADQHSDFTKT
jgi:hypothetical protein